MKLFDSDWSEIQFGDLLMGCDWAMMPVFIALQ